MKTITEKPLSTDSAQKGLKDKKYSTAFRCAQALGVAIAACMAVAGGIFLIIEAQNQASIAPNTPNPASLNKAALRADVSVLEPTTIFFVFTLNTLALLGAALRQGQQDREDFQQRLLIPYEPSWEKQFERCQNGQRPALESCTQPQTEKKSSAEVALNSAEEESIPQTFSQLISAPIQEIDERLFQHILGDYFGKDSGFEGYSSDKMLLYIRRFLDQRRESSDINACTLQALTNLSEHLQESEYLTKSFREDSTEVFKRNLEKTLGSKVKGDSCSFMIGWNGKSGGHAIFLQILIEDDEHYSALLFNRGAGMNYQPQAFLADMEQSIPFEEINEIEKDDLLSDVFLKGLREMLSPSLSGRWEAPDLYEGILPLLRGRKKNHSYAPEKAMENLLVGHCSFLSITAFLHENLPTLYPRLIFELQFKTLSDFFEQNESFLASDPSKQWLVLQGAQQLARNQAKLFEKGQLSENEMRFISKRLELISTALEQRRRESTAIPFYSTESEDAILSRPKELNNFDCGETPPLPSSLEVPEAFIPSIPDFPNDCMKWHEYFGRIYDQKDKDLVAARQMIYTWVRKIPISWISQPGIWKKSLTPQEAEALFPILAEIGLDLLRTAMNKKLLYSSDGFIEGWEEHNAHCDSQDPLSLFSTIKLLALTDAIAKDFYKSTGADLPGLYQFDFDLLFEQSGSVLFFDPDLEDQVRHLKAYWDRTDPPEERIRRNHLSFFGVEAFPPGGTNIRIHSVLRDSISCPITFEWPYLTWTANYLQRSSQGEVSWEDVLKATMDPAVMPPAYISLAELSWVSNSIFQYSSSYFPWGEKESAADLLPKLEPKDEKFKASSFARFWESDPDCPEYIERSHENERYDCSSINGCIHHHPRDYEWPSKPKGALLFGGVVDSNAAIEASQDFPFSLRSIYGQRRWASRFGSSSHSRERLRIGPHLRYQLHLQANEELDEAQMRELLALSAVRELQVVETLAYFTKNPHLLAKRDYQILFRNLLFQPPLLIDQLLRTPSLAYQLASFTKKRYLASEKFNDSQSSEFFLDINRYLSATVDYLQPQTDVSSKEAGFLDTRQELLEQIRKHAAEPQEQSPYWFDLVGMIGFKSLSELDAVDLLSAAHHLRLYPISQTHPSYSRSESYRIYNVLRRYQGALLEKLSDDAPRNRILNAVLHNVSPEQRGEFSWAPLPESNRVFHALGSNPPILINIATGEIKKENGIDSKVPEELLKHKSLKPFIRDGEFGGKIEKSCYQWTDANQLKIQAEIKDSISIRREVKPGVWARYHGGSLSDLSKGLLWPDHEILVEESSDSPRSWIVNSEGKILYQTQYTKDHLGVSRLAVIRPLLSGEEWTLEIPSKDCAIGRLEEPGFILVWKDFKNKMMSVEMPRYHLTFTNQGRGLETEKLPDFILEETGYSTANDPYPSLMLRRKDQKRRIWPNPLYPNSDVSKESGKQFFQANEIDGKFHPITSEDSLFLCLLKLKKADYYGALSFLDSEKSQLRAYTPLEKEILRQIASPPSEKKDLSPSSIAIHLKASYLLLRNELDFDGVKKFEEDSKSEEIRTILGLYRQHRSEVPIDLKLSTHEESWLLRKITRNLPGDGRLLSVGDPYSGFIDQEEKRLRESLYDFIEKGESFDSSDTNKNGSLLRKKGLASQFEKLFPIVDAEPKKESYQILYTELFEKVPEDSLSLEKISKEIETALSLIAMSRTEPEERAAALMLLVAKKKTHDDFLTKKKPSSDYIEVLRTYYALKKQRPLGSSINTTSSLPLESLLEKESSCPNASSPDFIPYSLALPKNLLAQESLPVKTTLPELANAFNTDSKDPAIETHLSDLSARLKDFSAAPQTIYHLQDREVLEQWRGEIENSIEQLQEESLQEKTELLLMANKPFSDPEKQEKRKAQIQGQRESAISMDDLILFSAFSDSSSLLQKNQALSCEEADAITHKTRTWLLQATHLQHLKRLFHALDQVKSMKEPEEISMALEEIAHLAKSQRNYDPKKHPSYLVFEFYRNILIWPEQVENLEKLQSNGVALEMIMGGGKTAVLTPLLAFEHADGNSLVVQMMPEALIPSMSEALKSSLWSAFSKTIELIEINRNTPLEPLNLQRLHSRLENAIIERKVVILSPNSLNSLLLRFVETVKKNPDADVREFQKIFRLLRSKGILVMDEMDLLLDVLQSHQFSYGDKKSLHQDRVLAVSHLYKLILTEESLKGKIRWNFVSELNGVDPLTKETYQEFQSLLIEKLLSSKLAPSQETKEFFNSLSAQEKDLLISYLKKEKNPDAESFVSQNPSTHIKNLLADWKEEIGGQTLLMTASAIVNENYGENPSTMGAMAIPFHGAEAPAVKSQFGTDLEILNYSIQTHLHSIHLKTLEKEIERLKRLVKKEFDEGKIKEVEKSSYYQEFLRLSCGKKYPLFQLTKAQLEEILAKVNENSEIKLELSIRYLLPTIQVFKESSEINMRSTLKLFSKRTKGFSGTFWNANSYPKDFDKKELSKTEVKTLSLLWEQNTPTSILPNQSTFKETIRTLFETHRGSIADRAGLFRGIDSEVIAREIAALPIWSRTLIKGIAFYDATGQKKILLLETKQVRNFEEANLSKQEIIAYWSQRYTTGSDIPLGPNMRTLVTIGQRTTMRDLLQAVWRNRQLHRSQRVSFIVPYEDSLVIKETLKSIGRAAKEELSLKDIFLYTKYLEAAKQGQHNLRALPYDLQNVLFESFLDELLEKEDLSSSLQILNEHFFKKSPEEPYQENGTVEELIPGSEFPKHAIHRLQQGADFQRRSPIEKKNIQKTWEEISQDALPHLPSLAPLQNHLGTEMQLEQETQQETEQETQRELEKQKSVQVELPDSYTPQPVYLWKTDGLFTRDYFTAQVPSNGTKAIPQEFSVIPNYEKKYRSDHPLDGLDVEGPDPLASLGIRLTQRLEAGTELFISLNAKTEHKNTNLLLIQDRKTNKVEVMLLNQWDALMFQRMLDKDKKTPFSGNRDVRLALYRPELGIISEGSDPMNLEEIKNTASFQRLIAQSKFFNDEKDYTKEELEQLRPWFREQGSAKMQNLFEGILRNKSTSLQIYQEAFTN